MKRFWPFLLLLLCAPIAIAGAAFRGIDKASDGSLVLRFSTGDVSLPVLSRTVVNGLNIGNGTVIGNNTAPFLNLQVGGTSTGGANYVRIGPNNATTPISLSDIRSSGGLAIGVNAESKSVSSDLWGNINVGQAAAYLSVTPNVPIRVGAHIADANTGVLISYAPTLFQLDLNGNAQIGPSAYGTAHVHSVYGKIVATDPVDEGPSEGLTSVTSGGASPGTISIVTCTMALAGSSGACGVHLQITTASQISVGLPNATTFVCDAVMGANGGANAASVGTCTALAGASAGTAVGAPTLSWSGTTASTSRQLQFSVPANSHADIKFFVARRGSGAAAPTVTFP